MRRRIGWLVVRAYPARTRSARGAEMVDTLLDSSEKSRRAFMTGCVSLLIAGMQQRGRKVNRLVLGGIALVACGAGAAIAVVTGSSSSIAVGGSARVPDAWIRANARAFGLVASRDSACRYRATRSSIRDGAPAPALSSTLAVLRRPAPTSERVSAAQLRRLHVSAQGVYIRYAREGVTDGTTYYMIPAANVGGGPLPDRCYTQQLSSFENQVTALPKTEHAEAISWARQLINQRETPSPGVVVATSGGGSFGATYVTLNRLRANTWSGGGGAGNNDITKTTLVLPNSVSTVTAVYSAQTYPGRVTRPLTITRQVSNNLLILVYRGAWDPPKLTYKSATGAVLWSTPSTRA
jgi:hypothetical protein